MLINNFFLSQEADILPDGSSMFEQSDQEFDTNMNYGAYANLTNFDVKMKGVSMKFPKLKLNFLGILVNRM